MAMDQQTLDQMREASSKKDPMIPRTVRLQKDLDRELNQFADTHGLDFSVVVRAVMSLGWKVFMGKDE